MVVFYISGHGFGHASRQIEVVNALFAAQPEARVAIRTSAARWLFDRTLRGPALLQETACDTGAIQRGSLEVDVEETIRAAAEFHASPGVEARIDREARALEALGAQLVIADVPPIAFAAARRAGVPAIALSNFTWDWIYGGYADAAAFKEAPWLLDRLRGFYAEATEAWRLPLAGGFESFGSITDWPFIARHARHAPEAVRARLGLPGISGHAGIPGSSGSSGNSGKATLILVSFGGFGAGALDLAAAAASLRGLAQIVITSSDDRLAALDGVLRVDEQLLYGSGLRYEDLVSAVDVVLTKPGYGIVSECVANRTRLLYTSRGRFREYDVFVEQMPGLLPCAFIDQADLLAGRWRAAVEGLLAQPERTVVATDGAARAAARILAPPDSAR